LQIFKETIWVNDEPGLPFIGKVGLWPFWTLVQVLLYNDVAHVPVNSFVSSFRHERIATVRKIYTRMHMHIATVGKIYTMERDNVWQC
jgi:hypothetical protein